MGALDGVRVLDVSNLYSAPLVGAILGDFGADVVKVEPPGGDPLRRLGVRDAHGESLMWAYANRNKRGIVLDLAGDGQPTFRALVERSDIVVENLPPDVRGAWRCSYDELSATAPHVIVVSVSCYGDDGPYAARPGAGTLAEAFAGLTHMTGEADGPPMLASVALGDAVTGIVGALGAVTAYIARGASGRGQHVDVSMYESVLQLLGGTVAGSSAGGAPPARAGSRVPGGAPRNVYRSGDGSWVAVSGTTDAQHDRLFALLGMQPSADPDAIDAAVAEWVAARDRDDVVDELLEARIPVSPVNDIETFAADPHVRARGAVVTVDGVRMIAPAPRLSTTPGRVRWRGPVLGEHTDVVVREWLGP